MAGLGVTAPYNFGGAQRDKSELFLCVLSVDKSCTSLWLAASGDVIYVETHQITPLARGMTR